MQTYSLLKIIFANKEKLYQIIEENLKNLNINYIINEKKTKSYNIGKWKFFI